MNPNRNKRLSFLITIFALTVFIAITSYLLLNQDEASENFSGQTYEIALLNPKSKDTVIYTQCLQAVEASGSSLDKTWHTYTADPKNSKSYETGIQEAISNNAKVIICPDATFAEPVYKLQGQYLHTYFLLLNSSQHNMNVVDNTIPFNVIPVQFSEAELGFLAGYALVHEGMTAITLLCAKDDACSVYYEYGFLQGADAAALDRNLKNINIECYYAADLEDAKKFATKHYQAADLLVSTCGQHSPDIYEIAKSLDKKLLTCNDCYAEPDTDGPLIAVTTKNVGYAVSDILSNFYSRTITGGQPFLYDAANKGISFKFSETYFQKFTAYTLQQIYNRLANDEIQIISDTTVSPKELGLKRIILK